MKARNKLILYARGRRLVSMQNLTMKDINIKLNNNSKYLWSHKTSEILFYFFGQIILLKIILEELSSEKNCDLNSFNPEARITEILYGLELPNRNP